MGITGSVITLNEAANIADCITSLKEICDEVIVVDSGSRDETVAIAKSMGAMVIDQPYLGDGLQKNVGPERAKNNWVLSIDADERLTPEMVRAIQGLGLDTTPYEAFAFRRRNYIGSRWVKHSGWYPDYCFRLYDKTKTRFAPVKEHARLETKNICFIKADIIHYSFKNLDELFSKPGRNYSTRAAKIMYLKNKRVSAFSPFMHGLGAFLKGYIIKKGFLGGVDGLSVSLSQALSKYLKYAKLLEYQRDQKVLSAEDFDKVF